MSIKYYTHFVTNEHQPQQPDTLREFTGVVELMQVPSSPNNAQEIAAILAHTLQIDSEDIHILHWSRLH